MAARCVAVPTRIDEEFLWSYTLSSRAALRYTVANLRSLLSATQIVHLTTTAEY